MSEQAITVTEQRKTTGTDLVRGEVLARVALGHSKRKIARDLHIGRDTVTAILAQDQLSPHKTTRIARIIPLAYDAVERTLRTNECAKAGDLGMRVLERTELAEQQGDRYTFTGDVSLQSITALLPATPQRAAAMPAITVEVEPPALPSEPVAGASLPPAETVEAEPVAAPARSAAAADASIRERRATEDRRCAENLRAAREEQRKHPYTQGSSRRVLSTAPSRTGLDWE